MWAMNQMRNPGSIYAALRLIQSCLHNEEFEDAERYARHAMFMINDMADNFIPSDQRPSFLADGSYFLSQAIYGLANAGGIPPEAKKKAGEEAIELARQALKLYIQLHGAESHRVACAMMALADALNCFNDVDDDEILSLYEQSNAINRRLEGSSSPNVATCESNMGNAYTERANRALNANDLDRSTANLELALSHKREAARIYRAINRVDRANNADRHIVQFEEKIRLIGTAIAAASTRS